MRAVPCCAAERSFLWPGDFLLACLDRFVMDCDGYNLCVTGIPGLLQGIGNCWGLDWACSSRRYK